MLMQPHEPGDVISPETKTTPQSQSAILNTNTTPTQTVPQANQPQIQSTPVPTPEAQGGWSFHAEDESTDTSHANYANNEPIRWTASEFIAHEKSPMWYTALVALSIVGSVLIYVLTKDIFSSVIIIIAAICFGIFAARKPKTVQYVLDDYGLHAGTQTFPFQSFKSFSLSDESAVAGIVFMPLKRFMPPITIYVAPEIANTALEFLSQRLPLEQHKTDAMDGLLRRIRF